MVRAGEYREWRQRGAAGENTLSQVRMETYALPLGCRQRAGLLPDPIRDA